MDDGIRQCHTQVCRGVRRRSVLQKSVTCYCVKELTIKFNFPICVFIGMRGQAIVIWVNSRMRMARLTGLLPCWRTYVSKRKESERFVAIVTCELTYHLFVLLLLSRRSTFVDLFAQIMVVMSDDTVKDSTTDVWSMLCHKQK